MWTETVTDVGWAGDNWSASLHQSKQTMCAHFTRPLTELSPVRGPLLPCQRFQDFFDVV
jgi:hypothetical protein